MKTVKKKLFAILYCLLQAAVGVLLLVNPVSFTAGILIAVGVVLTFLGVSGVIQYFRTPVEEAARQQLLTRGLLILLVGLFGVFGTGWLLMMFPIVTLIYGVIMLVVGVSKIQFVADTIRRREKRWFLSVISAIITLVCAGVVIANPFSSTTVLWMFTGIAIIVDAVFDLVALFFMKAPEDMPQPEQAPEEAPAPALEAELAAVETVDTETVHEGEIVTE